MHYVELAIVFAVPSRNTNRSRIENMQAEINDPESPCIGICQINPLTQLCDGCFRNEDEVANWWDLSASQKREVLDALELRKDQAFECMFE